jgi:pentatricopeptide repeat protein
MQCDGVYPDLVTSAYILKACGNLGACEAGIRIHADVEASGLLLTSPVVMTALIDMYAKCGFLAKAEAVFNKMPEADIVAWNALISGYALIGGTANAIAAFRRILADGCEPNSITYVTLLNACSHNGMVDIGCFFFFEAITREFDLTTHTSCMIDLLCRAGQLGTALDIVQRLPSHPSVVMWLMLLVACIRWSNAELGGSIFDQVLELHENESAAYVCMGTLYIYAEG